MSPKSCVMNFDLLAWKHSIYPGWLFDGPKFMTHDFGLIQNTWEPLNDKSIQLKSYNLHILTVPRISKHRHSHRNNLVCLAVTVGQFAYGPMAPQRVVDMFLLHQVTSHQSRRNSKLADRCRLVRRPRWGGGGGGGLLGLLHSYCQLGQIER